MSTYASSRRQETAGGTFCLIPYCHPDFSWTHHRDWHEERYAVTIAEALDLMAERSDFRFCIEPWIDQVIPFLERCPDRVEELRERLNSGQMGVLAFTLTSPRPATAADETFIRNMVLGREEYRRFAPQADLSVMSCPDVGIGHSQLPQILTLAGAKLYRGWRSEGSFTRKGVPREFLWRGLDGTEILTCRGYYGGMWTPERFRPWPPEDWDTWAEELLERELRYAYSQSQGKVWWLSEGSDDARPLRFLWGDVPLPLFDLVEEWNRRESSRMRFATPGEYRRLLETQSLPTWEGVIDPVDVAYNSGWLGGRGLWRLRQRLDTALVIAERACALAEAHGVPEVAGPEELREMWWETCRVASHAQQWAFERDWEWLITGAKWNLRRIEQATQQAVAPLAGVGRSSRARRPLVLFNPLPYPREEWVEVPWSQPRLEAGVPAVFDPAGAAVESQLGEPVGANFGEALAEASVIFRARVPAMGLAIYEIGDHPRRPQPPAPEGDVLRSAGLSLRFSPRGLQEINDEDTGLAWRAPEGSCIGDVRLYEMGPGILHVGPITAEISGCQGQGRWILTGPCRWAYRWETEFHGHRVRQDIAVDLGERYVDFLSRVYSVETQGFFALCFDLPLRGQMHVDIPFGVEARDLTDEPWSMDLEFSSWQNIERYRRNQFWARSWASVSDGKRAVSVITADGDRYWLWDATTGQLRHILYTATRDDQTDWEAWVTKDRMALGWHEFRHRLLLHPGDWRSADLCGQSDRLRVPIQPIKPLGSPPPLPQGEGAGGEALPAPVPSIGDQLALSPATVRLSAFYRAPQGYVLRLYESAGQATEAQVQLPFCIAQAQKVDFSLEPMVGAVSADGAQVRIPLRAWEIATVLLLPA